MEEKKVLHSEKIKEVYGGRELTEKGDTGLDLTNKEKFLESVKRLEPKSMEIPKELLAKVSGGSVGGGELDESDMRDLDCIIAFYKDQGSDMETMLRDMLNWGLSNEALWYLGSHW